MVWNSTQSALYKAVDAHNTCVSPHENSAEKNDEKHYEKRGVSENKIGCDGMEKHFCRGCSEMREKKLPSDPFSRLLSDKDMLLIAGLIFILMHENADKKLIIALAFVLLG